MGMDRDIMWAFRFLNLWLCLCQRPWLQCRASTDGPLIIFKSVRNPPQPRRTLQSKLFFLYPSQEDLQFWFLRCLSPSFRYPNHQRPEKDATEKPSLLKTTSLPVSHSNPLCFTTMCIICMRVFHVLVDILRELL